MGQQASVGLVAGERERLAYSRAMAQSLRALAHQAGDAFSVYVLEMLILHIADKQREADEDECRHRPKHH